MSRDQSHEQILEGGASFTLFPMTDDEAALWRSQDAEIRAQGGNLNTLHAKAIILEVVQRCPLLDGKYMIPRLVDDLLRRHKGLSQAVERCWQEGNSTAIRRLSVLRFPTVEEVLKKYPFDLVQADHDDDATHAQDVVLLDRFKDTPDAQFIISEVVYHFPRLDDVYAQVYEADKLLHRHKGLREFVETCWRTGSLSTIRRLSLLQDRRQLMMPRTSDAVNAQKTATIKAWDMSFKGVHHVRLVHYLNELIRLPHKIKHPYTNYLPIVQSAGTGKSRLVHEAAGLVFTLPFNICHAMNNNDYAYPLPDKRVREYLTTKEPNYERLRARIVCFIIALFDQTLRALKRSGIGKVDSMKSFALKWREYLGSADGRARFELYEMVINDAVKHAAEWTESETSEDIDILGTEVAPKVTVLIDYINTCIVHPTHADLEDLKVLLYFDEVHVLSDLTVEKTADGPECNYFDALISSLRYLIGVPVLTIVLSTNSDLSKLSPPSFSHPSARVSAENIMLLPPWTESPFDAIEEGRPFVRENTVTLDQVSKVEFMINFGRPIWSSRWNSGDFRVQQSIIDFARLKLMGRKSHNNNSQTKDDSKLAALCSRLMLHLEPWREQSRATDFRLVEGYMRIAFSVPKHCEYLRAGYPSEPILAEAAAQEMDHMASTF
ncbi:hypothetical protein B0H21DRAFT_825752 [Amylocystis lapponica]|nr:hypothetical protein B0H21DRAFT_825752 [Amylocystis lapponica]